MTIPLKTFPGRWSLLLGAALLSTAAFAAEPDKCEILLDLLVKRGVLSANDAAHFEQQVNAAAANPSVPIAVPTAMPTARATRTDLAAAAVKPEATTAPLSFKIGAADFTPFGFLDFTTAYRSELNGGDIGSSFGSIPYRTTAAGQLSETRFSAKNSRLGLRVDSLVGDTKVLGYVETDFLGNAATNVNVASNSNVLRMRVFFVDLRKGPWEFLAGQDWSMMTPNRKGLSPLPSDIFYSQNVDTNYQVGLVWGRTPQLRAVYHASDEITAGISLENPDQYVGGAVTLPPGFNISEVDAGANGTATPNVFPDVIGKVALDTKLAGFPIHLDAAALVRYFKINMFADTTNAAAAKTGFGGSINGSIALAPHFLLIGNAFDSDGGGRYLSTGLGPDFVVNPANASGDYSLSLVHSYAALGGLEWDVNPASKIFAYYGKVHYGQSYAQLPTGAYVGYGFPGSALTNNQNVEEYTVGLSQTLWKKPNDGDLKVMFQASYLTRNAWYRAPGTPDNAHLGTGYINLRYDLP